MVSFFFLFYTFSCSVSSSFMNFISLSVSLISSRAADYVLIGSTVRDSKLMEWVEATAERGAFSGCAAGCSSGSVYISISTMAAGSSSRILTSSVCSPFSLRSSNV